MKGQTSKRFEELCAEVQACRKCQRMQASARVLNHASGSLSAAIMFVGEAPGRLGADTSEIPFHGDKAGHNFEGLLAAAGLTRESVFVTNAVLCNPRGKDGNNATPLISELENCSRHLRRQIDIVRPKIVVTLGASALAAVALLEPHNTTLKEGVRSLVDWYGRKLIPLYHPGQRAMVHRAYAVQEDDYKFIARVASEKLLIGGLGKLRLEVAPVVHEIVAARPSVSYFALHKLLYLFEVEQVKRHGQQLTRAFFVRQKDGPYCVDLQPLKLKRMSLELRRLRSDGVVIVCNAPPDLFDRPRINLELRAPYRQELAEVVQKHGHCGHEELKRHVYLTRPMRAIVRHEKKLGKQLMNVPIDLQSSYVPPQAAARSGVS